MWPKRAACVADRRRVNDWHQLFEVVREPPVERRVLVQQRLIKDLCTAQASAHVLTVKAGAGQRTGRSTRIGGTLASPLVTLPGRLESRTTWPKVLRVGLWQRTSARQKSRSGVPLVPAAVNRSKSRRISGALCCLFAPRVAVALSPLRHRPAAPRQCRSAVRPSSGAWRSELEVCRTHSHCGEWHEDTPVPYRQTDGDGGERGLAGAGVHMDRLQRPDLVAAAAGYIMAAPLPDIAGLEYRRPPVIAPFLPAQTRSSLPGAGDGRSSGLACRRLSPPAAPGPGVPGRWSEALAALLATHSSSSPGRRRGTIENARIHSDPAG
jgi:hypothetical protein